MRLQRHLIEKVDPYQEYILDNPDIPDDDRDIITMLHRDCSLFLKSQTFGQKCFRGSNKSIYGNYELRVPRKDRKPSDVPSPIHNALDKEFKKMFGWKPRSEGVFCAPNVYIAENYGKEYYFFPIGKFKMLYREGTNDIILLLKDNKVMTGSNDGWKQLIFGKELDAVIKDIVSEYEQDTNYAKSALYSDAEIMCQCKSYYMVKTKWVTKYYNEVFSISKDGFAQGKKL